MPKPSVVFIGAAIFLSVGAASHPNGPDLDVTKAMTEYLQLHQSNYEEKMKKCDEMLADFRSGFFKELKGLNLQTELLQDQVEDAWSRLKPYELIDSWHRQCVRNYSSVIPSAYQAKASMNECSKNAQDYYSGLENRARHSYTSIKSLGTYTFKNDKRSCELTYKKSQAQYNNCIKKSVATLETNLARHWREFQKNLDEVKFNAKTRIRTAWQCAFNILHTTSYNLGSSLRLINDCISNERSCGSISCAPRCPHEMQLDIKERDFQRITIKNPFHGADRHLGCMELRFK